MCNGLKYGSNNSLSGSTLIGDWRRPLLHIFHCGLMSPQNAGPAKTEMMTKIKIKICNDSHNIHREINQTKVDQNIFFALLKYSSHKPREEKLFSVSCIGWEVWCSMPLHWIEKPNQITFSNVNFCTTKNNGREACEMTSSRWNDNSHAISNPKILYCIIHKMEMIIIIKFEKQKQRQKASDRHKCTASTECSGICNQISKSTNNTFSMTSTTASMAATLVRVVHANNSEEKISNSNQRAERNTEAQSRIHVFT